MPRYTVTDRAPPKVAGRRVQAGDVLDLSETEARHEVLAGHIRAVEEGSEGSQSPSKKASKGA